MGSALEPLFDLVDDAELQITGYTGRGRCLGYGARRR